MAQDLAIIWGEPPRLVPLAKAMVSVMDLGLLRGMGVFETIRTYGGNPYALTAHLERLWKGAKELGVSPVFTEKELRQVFASAYRHSGYDEVRLNIVITAGELMGDSIEAIAPTAIMTIRPLGSPPTSDYEEGIAVVTFPAQRMLPEHKTTNYLTGRTGLLLAKEKGAKEALYVDPEGCVTEGVTTNVLVVKDDVVFTPKTDCLPGITRDGIQRVAIEFGLGWQPRRLWPSDLESADEVWICSSVRELLSVVIIDDKVIGDGLPGSWGPQVRAAFHGNCMVAAAKDVERQGPSPK
ncbi:MAG: hypothetical protein HN348_04285 [Proteobacteria bacterium]|jgi:branched-chain amino acid aminotransferase|nr:hypothetical protein [Pseudomonadota bacterium]